MQGTLGRFETFVGRVRTGEKTGPGTGGMAPGANGGRFLYVYHGGGHGAWLYSLRPAASKRGGDKVGSGGGGGGGEYSMGVAALIICAR